MIITKGYAKNNLIITQGYGRYATGFWAFIKIIKKKAKEYVDQKLKGTNKCHC